MGGADFDGGLDPTNSYIGASLPSFVVLGNVEAPTPGAPTKLYISPGSLAGCAGDFAPLGALTHEYRPSAKSSSSKLASKLRLRVGRWLTSSY